MYARLGWIDQPMKMRETSRVQDKKPIDNNELTKKDQAKIIWLESKRMVKKSPTLSKKVKALVAELDSDFNDGVFKSLASDSDTLDGLNIHCALMDRFCPLYR